MNKIALQELKYDIERSKNWDKIHDLIMDYANNELEKESENIFENFNIPLWDEIIDSIEHGEILDKEILFIENNLKFSV